jgi:hypothetical protein
MAKSSDLSSDFNAIGLPIADQDDRNFTPVATLPDGLINLHVTFVNESGVVATFGRDNAKHLRDWWLVQCAKLNNPRRSGFWLMMNVREFTNLRDLKTGRPIKRLSSCVFRNGELFEPLSADAVRRAFTTDAATEEALPPQTDIVFVDFVA